MNPQFETILANLALTSAVTTAVRRLVVDADRAGTLTPEAAAQLANESYARLREVSRLAFEHFSGPEAGRMLSEEANVCMVAGSRIREIIDAVAASMPAPASPQPDPSLNGKVFRLFVDPHL